jgi:hypothetical protein
MHGIYLMLTCFILLFRPLGLEEMVEKKAKDAADRKARIARADLSTGIGQKPTSL